MKTLLREIARRWIIGNPVKIGQNVSGQEITEGNCYLLGCVAGPDKSVEYLLHEMAHLSEREPSKLLEKPVSGWGFSQGKYWEVAGKCGWEPQTDQSVQREARVWAYQLSLMRELNREETAENLVSSAVYLPAFCYFKSPLRDKSNSFSQNEAVAVKHLAAQVEKMAKSEFTFERWQEEWFARMELLR